MTKRKWLVDIHSLAVRPDEWVSVQPGHIDVSTLSRLEERGFDQAPVLSPMTRKALGLVETSYLRHLADSHETLRENDEAFCARHNFLRIASELELPELLSSLATTRAVLVTDRMDEDEVGEEILIGLVTISDLNRHPVRAALYSVIAGLELELANVVSRIFSDPWNWISCLNEQHQVAILGYWELTRRRGVDTSPVAATTLTQLLQALRTEKPVLTRLGFKSKADFDAATGHVPTLRNCVMHPVRPLVLEQADVAKIFETVRVITGLIERIETAGGTILGVR